MITLQGQPRASKPRAGFRIHNPLIDSDRFQGLMMIKGGERVIRRSQELIRRSQGLMRNSLGTLGDELARVSSSVLFRLRIVQEIGHYETGLVNQAPVAGQGGSPLDNVGPVPEELRVDPFPGGSIPWSIQEAELQRIRKQELMILKCATIVSWAVTIISIFRALGYI